MAVSASQRFTRNFPCPLCGGYKELAQHQSTRCWGFISSDERFVMCERDEIAGRLTKGEWGYLHAMHGRCGCGVEHGSYTTVRQSPAPRREAPRSHDRKPRGFETASRNYEIRTEQGELVAIHVRREFEDGSKTFAWRSPAGDWHLDLPLSTLPLYGMERLPHLPDFSVVFVTEGEKAAQSLIDRGYNALGTACGASSIPSDVILKRLIYFDVHCWADNDEDGRRHMERIAERLTALGGQPRFVSWTGAPPKGDAADFEGDVDLLLSGATAKESLPLPEFDSADTSAENERLADHLETFYDWNKAQDLRHCGTRWMGYRCPNHHLTAKPKTCGQQWCADCSWWRLEWDWRFKLASLMQRQRWDIYLIRPTDSERNDGQEIDLKTMRKRLNKSKDRARRNGKPINMVYGVGYGEDMTPTLIVAQPTGDEPLTNAKWEVEPLWSGLTEKETMRAFQGFYRAELKACQTAPDLCRIVGEARGRHRFQGAGPMFSESEGDMEGRDSPLNASSRKVAPPSGGSGHGQGSKEAMKCVRCGSLLEYVGEISVEQVHTEPIAGGKWHQWEGMMNAQRQRAATGQPVRKQWSQDVEAQRRTRDLIDALGR